MGSRFSFISFSSLTRGFFVFLVLFIAVVSLLFTQQFVTKANAEAPIKIMVVGDSISQGHSGDYTWRYRLWQHLTTNNSIVDFVGPKDTVYDDNNPNSLDYLDPNFDRDHDATWGRFLLDETGTIASEVTSYTPDVLLVALGTNDLVWNGKTGEQVANDLSTLVTNACTAKPDIKIVLSKITPLGGRDAAFNARWADYNDRIASVAASATNCTQPLVVSDPLPGFAVTGDTYDNVHPTPSGEYKIAAAFANALWNGYGIGATYGAIPTPPAWPQAPVNLIGTAGSTMATVSWDPVPGALGYYVYRKNLTTGQVFSRVSVTSPSTGNIYLVNGNTYEYSVSTFRWYVEGPKSTPVQVTPLYPAPTGLTAQPLNQGVRLDWNPVGNVVYYWIYMRNVTRGEVNFTKLTYPTSTNSFTGGMMNNGETYEFKVSAVNGKLSTSVSATPNALAPAPTGLTATAGAIGTKQITLNWNAVANTSTYTVTGYQVWMKDTNVVGSTFTKWSSKTTATSVMITNLIAQHTYQFKVTTVNLNNAEGPDSLIVSKKAQ